MSSRWSLYFDGALFIDVPEVYITLNRPASQEQMDDLRAKGYDARTVNGCSIVGQGTADPKQGVKDYQNLVKP